MPPYPTAYEIEDIFKYRESPETMPLWDERLAKNFEGKVMGDHHFSGHHKGADAWRDAVRESVGGMLDSKGISMEIINVVGGGESPWAAVEQRNTGRAKSGKKWVHESVAVVRFNLEGKITTLRAYFDTAHMNDHKEEHHKRFGKDGS